MSEYHEGEFPGIDPWYGGAQAAYDLARLSVAPPAQDEPPRLVTLMAALEASFAAVRTR